MYNFGRNFFYSIPLWGKGTDSELIRVGIGSLGNLVTELQPAKVEMSKYLKGDIC